MKHIELPTMERIRSVADTIAPYIVETPVFRWKDRLVDERLGPETEIHLKLELFQRTGSFKVRGALNSVLALSDEERRRGVTAISSGNHAVATAYAAQCVGTHAKVVMLATANRARVEAAKAYGAEVIIAEDGPAGFRLVDEIATQEGRSLIHPFEGPRVTEGTSTCALEVHNSVPDLDAIVVAIGAGGLASGLSVVTSLVRPDCKVYAVEPVGAPNFVESLKLGAPGALAEIDTIADSLAPPMLTPYVFGVCSQLVEDVVLVSDDQIASAVAILFDKMKLAVEPAGAAALAGALGPLADRLKGKKVAVMVCGSNIDIDGFSAIVRRGQSADLFSAA